MFSRLSPKIAQCLGTHLAQPHKWLVVFNMGTVYCFDSRQESGSGPPRRRDCPPGLETVLRNLEDYNDSVWEAQSTTRGVAGLALRAAYRTLLGDGYPEEDGRMYYAQSQALHGDLWKVVWPGRPEPSLFSLVGANSHRGAVSASIASKKLDYVIPAVRAIFLPDGDVVFPARVPPCQK